MTDYVSASASRMRGLAREIKECSDAILSNEPGIKSGIDGWEATVDTSALRNLAGWLKDQAPPMLDRADWAQTALSQPRMGMGVLRVGDWRDDIPWTVTPEMLRQEGHADASQLANRTRSDQPMVIRQQAAREAAWALEAHVDDPEWLEAFFANGGAKSLASVPRQMLERDGLPLSKESEQQLHWYGVGIARATSLQEQGKIKLAGDVWDPISNPAGGDMWSSGMLVAHGPRGDQYGVQFLAGLADAALAWKEKHGPMRPPYRPRPTGIGSIPKGYVQKHGDWWASLGIDVSHLHIGAKEAADGVAKIRANDPLSFILGRTGENPGASRALLREGPDGLEHARQLVDVHWQTPGPVPEDDSGPAASVIRAATFDRIKHGKESAHAALNVIKAGNSLYYQERNDQDKEQYPKLPSGLARSLSFVAAAYSDDVAASSDRAKRTNGVVNEGAGEFHIGTNTEEISGFLHTFMTDPAAAGALEGALRARLTASAQLQSAHPKIPNQLGNLGRLLGMMNLTASKMKFDAAEAEDGENAKNKVYFDAVTGIASGMPGLSKVPGLLLVVSSEVAAANGDALFPDDNADKAADASQAVTYRNLQDMRIEIAQGLLQGSELAPPGRSFYEDGVIKIRTEQEAVEFEVWWGKAGEKATDFEDRAQAGFDEASLVFAAK